MTHEEDGYAATERNETITGENEEASPHRVLSLWVHQSRLHHIQRLTQERSTASLQRKGSGKQKSADRRGLVNTLSESGFHCTQMYKTWYLQQWSWKESVWACYLPSSPSPTQAAWPGHNTPTGGGKKKHETETICVISKVFHSNKHCPDVNMAQVSICVPVRCLGTLWSYDPGITLFKSWPTCIIHFHSVCTRKYLSKALHKCQCLILNFQYKKHSKKRVTYSFGNWLSIDKCNFNLILLNSIISFINLNMDSKFDTHLNMTNKSIKVFKKQTIEAVITSGRTHTVDYSKEDADIALHWLKNPPGFSPAHKLFINFLTHTVSHKTNKRSQPINVHLSADWDWCDWPVQQWPWLLCWRPWWPLRTVSSHPLWDRTQVTDQTWVIGVACMKLQTIGCTFSEDSVEPIHSMFVAAGNKEKHQR